MRLKLSIFTAVLMVLAGFMTPQVSHAQTVSLVPSVVPNGVQASSGQQYRQRINITLGGSAVGQTVMLTITAPPEVTIATGSASAVTSSTLNVVSNFATTTSTITLGMVGSSIGNTTIAVEFDVTTPNSFAGVGSGAKIDTVYSIAFAAVANQTTRTVNVAKHNDRPIRLISFVAPDSSRGDTTIAGGRYYKLKFANSLLDIAHTAMSGLTADPNSAAGGGAPVESSTDIAFSFYLSTDSTLIRRPSALSRAGFVTLEPTRTPLIGTRQRPRTVPYTFVREGFTTLFGSTGLDTLNGVISLDGTADNTVYYVYTLADPNVERTQTAANTTSRKVYDPTEQGTLTAGRFLGRSGPLLVQHPPEFVVAGWDYDNDGSDDFNTTGEIQIGSDQIDMTTTNNKDNINITVDSGGFFNKGAALASLSTTATGALPGPITTVDMLFVAQDADNSQSFKMNIFLSTASGLKESNLIGAGIDSLDGAVKMINADTLSINQNTFTFNPIVRDSVTNLISSFVPEGDYFVYFAGTDGTYRTVYQVFNDPFASTLTASTLSVKHSPTMSLDAFALNDFDGDGALDVVTGIGVSQMVTDIDGKNLSLNPSTRYVNIFWGGTNGMNGDLDVDNNATIDLYYSTHGGYRAAGKSAAYTSGNSDGTDLIADQALTTPFDTHLIASGLAEDPDGQYDDNYQWDLWTYVSPESTVPRTGVKYYLYALMKGGATSRLVSLTQINSNTPGGAAQSVQFQHPPYVRALEPSQDITVSVDEPVFVSWEGFDVDNAESGGLTAVPSGQSGKLAPNGRGDSPNVRILLTSADFGEVTTWGTLTNAATTTPFFLANSGSGGIDDEVELNEGVDTSFVFSANKMRRHLATNAATQTSLQTNGGVGITYYVYVAMDDGIDGAVADQPTDFGERSPMVRAPGRITFTGSVPTNPATSNRFIIPKEFTIVGNEQLQVPVIPDSLLGGQTVGNVSLFMSIDPTYWTPVDTDPNTAGTQPFTLGKNSQLSASNVAQGTYTQNGKLRLDFIYNDQTTGLTFFDGKQPLVFLNLTAKAMTGASSTINTEITIDNTEPRKSKMLVMSTNQDLFASIPSGISVDIVRRGSVSGSVPLQGRTTSADTVTFFLREVGDLKGTNDALFIANDVNPTKAGVQVVTTGVNGAFTLNNVPDGRWVLTASVPRHLTGQDTINVLPGVDMSNVRPTLDGKGQDRAQLLAGDASGYTDSTGVSIPDNVIDAQDTNTINAALFTVLGGTGYNTFADMNRDSVVNATDKNYAAANTTSNIGTAGTITPVFPNFKQVVTEGDNKEAKVSLVGLPEGEIRMGETFDVTVQVDQAVTVRAYEVHLDYDASKLEVDNIVSNGSLFEWYLHDMAGKIVEDGKLGLANAILGSTPYGASGEGTLATVRFRVIDRGGEACLKLSDAMLIDVENLEAKPQVNAQDILVSLSNDAAVYHDADGNEIHSLILAGEDNKVDFNDFVLLAQHFGTSSSDEGYDIRADINGDDLVNFADFLLFTQDFGKVAIDAPSATRASKVTPKQAGANNQAEMSLKIDGLAKMGEDLVVEVDLSQATALSGWGVTVGFDATQYEFVQATAPEGHLLSGSGNDAPIFLVHSDKTGQVSLANALTGDGVATGEGSLARLVFRPKGEFEDVRFEVFEGVLFDANRLENPASSAVLNVRAVPSEFGLAQNYPNPFNPETTITYDLAADSNVRLEIYNVMGQLVRTLVRDQQAAGRYRISWLGDNSLGHQVASGVYFYRIQADGFHSVKKLMLLK